MVVYILKLRSIPKIIGVFTTFKKARDRLNELDNGEIDRQDYFIREFIVE